MYSLYCPQTQAHECHLLAIINVVFGKFLIQVPRIADLVAIIALSTAVLPVYM